MDIGSLHVEGGNFLTYLTIAYTLFFLVIFGYVATLAQRQNRLRHDLVLLQSALEEEKANATASAARLREHD